MTKKQVFAEARRLRAEGHVVKVFCRSGTYTQPGRGIVAFEHYYTRIVGRQPA